MTTHKEEQETTFYKQIQNCPDLDLRDKRGKRLDLAFNLLGLTPGQNIVNVISDTFGVELPKNIVGMIVSATVGSVLIIFIFGLIKGKRNRA